MGGEEPSYWDGITFATVHPGMDLTEFDSNTIGP
jgi:hypothetical protein